MESTCPRLRIRAFVDAVGSDLAIASGGILAADEDPAHDAIPEIAGNGTADGRDDDVGEAEHAAPQQHAGGPEQREKCRAPLQSGFRVHQPAPIAP
jgi:hypothetical protein